MKRLYIAPETRQLHLLINCLQTGSSNSNNPPTGYYYDDNGKLVPINPGGEDDDPSSNSRYLRQSMWED